MARKPEVGAMHGTSETEKFRVGGGNRTVSAVFSDFNFYLLISF